MIPEKIQGGTAASFDGQEQTAEQTVQQEPGEATGRKTGRPTGGSVHGSGMEHGQVRTQGHLASPKKAMDLMFMMMDWTKEPPAKTAQR